MARLIQYILEAVTRPRAELTRRQHQVRYAWELVVHCGRQLRRHRAEGMAAELTYRTIFALIPVVVLGLVLFRVVGGLEDVQTRVEDQLYSFFGVPEIPAGYDEGAAVADGGPDDGDDPPGAASDSAAVAVPLAAADVEDSDREGDDRRQAQASIRQTLHEAARQVLEIDFRSIGVVGLLLFVYAAIALADSTGHLFNLIFDAPSQRPIHIRVAIHWSIITLGTGLLAFSLYLSGQFLEWFGEIGTGSWAPWILARCLSYLASWLLLFLLYALMPNTHVSVRAAAIGAAVAAGLWELAKFGFQVYVATAVPYSALYGSLGLIPLFLFWIYLTWWIVLFGVILTHSLQTLRGRRPTREDEFDDLPRGDPAWMLPIMVGVAQAFERGEAIGRQDLADRLGLSATRVQEMIPPLLESGMLRRVDGGAGLESTFCLAKPANRIPLRSILELAQRLRPGSDHPGWRKLTSIGRAELEAAGEETLADVAMEGEGE